MATTYSIEANVPVFDHRGEIIGYDGQVVWNGDDLTEARIALPHIKKEYDDSCAVVREFVDGVMTREISVG